MFVIAVIYFSITFNLLCAVPEHNMYDSVCRFIPTVGQYYLTCTAYSQVTKPKGNRMLFCFQTYPAVQFVPLHRQEYFAVNHVKLPLFGVKYVASG